MRSPTNATCDAGLCSACETPGTRARTNSRRMRMNWKDQIAIRAYRKVQMRAWRKKHPGRAAAQKRAWRKKNKKRARALSLAHYYKYREKILEQKKAWYWGDHKA